jgi:putative transposase
LTCSPQTGPGARSEFLVDSRAAEARWPRAGGGRDGEVEVQRGADRVRAEAGGVGYGAGGDLPEAICRRRSAGGDLPEAICRRLGVTQATFCRWEKEFAGTGVSEVRRLRVLEEESRKLKPLVAGLGLDEAMLRGGWREKGSGAGSGA